MDEMTQMTPEEKLLHAAGFREQERTYDYREAMDRHEQVESALKEILARLTVIENKLYGKVPSPSPFSNADMSSEE